jgi:hypothetical protein
VGIRRDGTPPDPGGWDLGLAGREALRQRQLCVRLDSERFAVLEDLARREGLTPTTMARVMVIRALRGAEDEWE